jgi:glutathione peroxidase
MPAIHDFTATTLEGELRSLGEFRGHLLLIVNVASRCRFTPQYAGLEALQRRFAGQGFTVLGFPCDQFGHQEPGTAGEIRAFCEREYGVTFPMFGKIEVNGPHAHPLYRFLKREAPGLFGIRAIKWNFTKFLIDRDGRVLRRFAPVVTPEKIADALRARL